MSPKDPNGHYSTACLKQAVYDVDWALKDYDIALAIAPNFWNCLNNRGTLKDESNDYAGAIADYNRIIDSDKSSREDKQRALFDKGSTDTLENGVFSWRSICIRES